MIRAALARLRPESDREATLILGLILLGIGLAVWVDIGAGLALPGLILVVIALLPTYGEESE